jgi:hypothetical protein
VVDGRFSLPGRSAADLQRGGLNFSEGVHGNGHGQTVRVGADGTYSVSLAAGTYTVVGALSGQPAETCGETMTVVVVARTTTRSDFVCHTVAATSSTP